MFLPRSPPWISLPSDDLRLPVKFRGLSMDLNEELKKPDSGMRRYFTSQSAYFEEGCKASKLEMIGVPKNHSRRKSQSADFSNSGSSSSKASFRSSSSSVECATCKNDAMVGIHARCGVAKSDSRAAKSALDKVTSIHEKKVPTAANFGRIDDRELILSRGASSSIAKSQRRTKEI